ncbi:MAG: TIGR04086 family membrane protein [Ruminococcus sp.]|nr:TIGR04086 family membrane protein [Ruminococcus sp.]
MSDKKLLLKAVLFGTVCGLLISVILTCVFTVIILTTGLLPADITNYVTVAILAVGTFLGGMITTKITKSAGLTAGLITGLSIFMLVTIIGLTKSNDSVTIITLIKLAATLISGGLGGIAGLRKKERIHIK